MKLKKYKSLPYSEPKVEVLDLNDKDILSKTTGVVKSEKTTLFASAYADGSDNDSEGCEFGGDSSDLILKENVTRLEKGLKQITSISGYEYFWKDKSKDSRKQYGVIAQEVQNVFPELTKKGEQSDTLEVKYNGLIAPMIEAIKELNCEVQSLKSENKAMMNLLSELLEKSSKKETVENDDEEKRDTQ